MFFRKQQQYHLQTLIGSVNNQTDKMTNQRLTLKNHKYAILLDIAERAPNMAVPMKLRFDAIKLAKLRGIIDG